MDEQTVHRRAEFGALLAVLAGTFSEQDPTFPSRLSARIEQLIRLVKENPTHQPQDDAVAETLLFALRYLHYREPIEK